MWNFIQWTQPRPPMSGPRWASKQLFVIILATLLRSFWSFWNWSISVVLRQPHTGQQYQKWSSAILEYKVFKEAIGTILFVCLKNLMVLDTLVDTALVCSFQFRLLSTWTQRYLDLLTTSNSLPRNFEMQSFCSIVERSVLRFVCDQYRLCFSNT